SVLHPKRGRDGIGRQRVPYRGAMGWRQPLLDTLDVFSFRAPRREAAELLAKWNVQPALQVIHLRLAQKGRVVLGIPGNRQPPAFDRVRDDDDGAIANAFRLGVGIEDQSEVVAAQVGQERPYLGGRAGGQKTS